MSIQFNAAPDRLRITSGELDWNFEFTEMGYFKVNALTGGLQTMFTILRDDVSAYIFVGILSDGTFYYENAAGGNFTGPMLSLGVWYNVAYTYQPSGLATFYINGANLGTGGSPGMAGTPDQMEQGGWRTTNGNRFNGSEAALKSWNKILDDAEIGAEVGFAAPQDSTDIYGVWYLRDNTDYLDQSGNGHDWTELGSPSSSANPPGVIFPSSEIAIPVLDISYARRRAS